MDIVVIDYLMLRIVIFIFKLGKCGEKYLFLILVVGGI